MGSTGSKLKKGGSQISRKLFARNSTDKIEDCRFLVKIKNVVSSRYTVDEDEIARLNAIHFLEKEFWGGAIFSAPITKQLEEEHGFKVLDVGCGNGVWTLDMATTYPNASFTGVDIMRSFPNEIKPDNVEFVLENVISGLNFKSNSFDYVFMRQMKSAIPINVWPKVLEELLRVLKPNSWLEIVDSDDIFIDGNDEIKELIEKVERKVNEKFGVTFRSISHVKRYFLEDNPDAVTDFQSFGKKIPISGTWSTPLENKIAEISLDNMYWGANNLKNSFDCLDFSSEEYDEYINRVFGSVKNIRCTYTNRRLIAKKSLN